MFQCTVTYHSLLPVLLFHFLSLSLSPITLSCLSKYPSLFSPKYYSADPLVCSSLWWWRFYAKRSPKPFAILRWLIFSHSHPLFVRLWQFKWDLGIWGLRNCLIYHFLQCSMLYVLSSLFFLLLSIRLQYLDRVV